MTDLPRAVPPVVVDVGPGGSFDLRVQRVAKQIGHDMIAMLAYDGSIPGPTLQVRQGSEIVVHVTNELESETTVHWHGLRLENRYDGVPHETQAPIPPGGRYTHHLTFPDAGLFWYHPHVREDLTQELGLYGNVLVEPDDPSYWPPSDREIIFTLDDILIEDGQIAPFEDEGPNFVAMGRFGNVFLTGGETAPRREVERGEVVRFHLTNTANTRVFKVALPNVAMKLVGGDAGRYEYEQWVDHVVIAPSERAIVDALFEEPGEFVLQHLTPEHSHDLARIAVRDGGGGNGAASSFRTLRVNAEMVAERERLSRYFAAPPDRTLALVAEMDVEEPQQDGPVVYACPMHPDVTSDRPGKCPRCGMKLMVSKDAIEQGDHGSAHGAPAAHHDHEAAMADGIEWEDLMADTNRATTYANMRWKIIDRDTGKENGEIDWAFTAGDLVKVRVVNEMDSDHPMHHPFHVHGERFIVITRDGNEEPNLVWKDTVLIRTGETVDILMDASNPGRWMAHCHIPEHMGSGMMFSFDVRRPA